MTSFLDLHRPGRPLLLPNPWDAGSARVLDALGFEALATTSSGFAATLGRADMSVTRDEALAHAAAIVAVTPLPVSADLENGFADDPDGVAADGGDGGRGRAGRLLDRGRHRSRRRPDLRRRPGHRTGRRRGRGGRRTGSSSPRGPRTSCTVATMRAGFADVVARLQSFQAAGAHVLYAPGLTDIEHIRTVVAEVDRPVNVLALPGAPTVAELADAGVARVSVGGAFAFAALGALVDAAREFQTLGTYGFTAQTRKGREIAGSAFG